MPQAPYSFVPPHLPFKAKYLRMVDLYNTLARDHLALQQKLDQTEELIKLTHRTTDTLSDILFSQIEDAGIAERPDYLECDEESEDYGAHTVAVVQKVHAIAQCGSILLKAVAENMSDDTLPLFVPDESELAVKLPEVVYSELPDEVIAAGAAAIKRRQDGPGKTRLADTYVAKKRQLYDAPLDDKTRRALAKVNTSLADEIESSQGSSPSSALSTQLVSASQVGEFSGGLARNLRDLINSVETEDDSPGLSEIAHY